MTAVVFPRRAVVTYVNALFCIAGEATRDAATLNRDAATLTRQAVKLIDGSRQGRAMGVLRHRGGLSSKMLNTVPHY